MKRSRKRRERPAAGSAGEDLPVEDARHPDRPAVTRHAFNQAMPGIDRQHGLRLDSRRSGERQQRRSPKRSGDQLLKLAVNGRRCSDIFAALEHLVRTPIVGHEPACFADQQNARRSVP